MRRGRHPRRGRGGGRARARWAWPSARPRVGGENNDREKRKNRAREGRLAPKPLVGRRIADGSASESADDRAFAPGAVDCESPVSRNTLSFRVLLGREKRRLYLPPRRHLLSAPPPRRLLPDAPPRRRAARGGRPRARRARARERRGGALGRAAPRAPRRDHGGGARKRRRRRPRGDALAPRRGGPLLARPPALRRAIRPAARRRPEPRSDSIRTRRKRRRRRRSSLPSEVLVLRVPVFVPVLLRPAPASDDRPREPPPLPDRRPGRLRAGVPPPDRRADVHVPRPVHARAPLGMVLRPARGRQKKIAPASSERRRPLAALAAAAYPRRAPVALAAADPRRAPVALAALIPPGAPVRRAAGRVDLRRLRGREPVRILRLRRRRLLVLLRRRVRVLRRLLRRRRGVLPVAIRRRRGRGGNARERRYLIFFVNDDVKETFDSPRIAPTRARSRSFLSKVLSKVKKDSV